MEKIRKKRHNGLYKKNLYKGERKVSKERGRDRERKREREREREKERERKRKRGKEREECEIKFCRKENHRQVFKANVFASQET